MKIQLSENKKLLESVEQRNRELGKSEEELEKCMEEKQVLEAEQEDSNITTIATKDELLENITKYRMENELLHLEITKLRQNLTNSDTMRVDFGKTIVKLREQVESFNKFDAKQAEKLYHDEVRNITEKVVVKNKTVELNINDPSPSAIENVKPTTINTTNMIENGD